MDKNHLAVNFSWDKEETIRDYDIAEKDIQDFEYYLQDKLHGYVNDAFIFEDIVDAFKNKKESLSGMILMSRETLIEVLEQKDKLLKTNEKLAEAIKEKNKEIYELKKTVSELQKGGLK